ncbi:MAG: molybdopterin molybdotransferase MoeA [Anaerolineales bacterium]|nr:molybdopterin molybdotransferase MoeA [Anaerolineales bacterium]MCK5315664.1 molybdopterin molybdotransferase MoeA [Anaerolineales bacterium]
MNELVSVTEARHRLLESFGVLDAEIVPLKGAVGRVLAQPLTSELDLPPFTNSSMDGFAVQSMDVSSAKPAQPVILSVVGDIPAGKIPEMIVKAGQAVRIMTGAPIPDGADSVVPVEDTDFNQRQPGTPAPKQVAIYQPIKAGGNLRPIGQDVHRGEVLLDRGQRLRPQDVGLCAMIGVDQVPVHRKPIVTVLSTGDELLTVGAPVTPGKIYDSNIYTLISLVEKYGGQPLNLGIVPDREKAVKICLEMAVSKRADLILSSAGVSVGAYDFVKSVVEKNGNLQFWRVNMRPGKPLAFGDYQGIPFIGLPGNPVSAFVGFEVFVRPAINKSVGLPVLDRATRKVHLLEAIESDGRESFLRAVVINQNGNWFAHLTGHQGSGNLRSLVQANALLLVPSGVKSLPIGAQVDAWLLDDSLV